MAEFYADEDELIAGRRAAPGDDLISALIETERRATGRASASCETCESDAARNIGPSDIARAAARLTDAPGGNQKGRPGA